MARSSTTWKKGQSGNTKENRIPERPLASALASAGDIKDKEGFTPKEKVSKLIWEFMETGGVVFKGDDTRPGRTLQARTIQEWIDGMKFVYRHLDGDAPKHLSVATPDLNMSAFAYEQLDEDERAALREALKTVGETVFDPEVIEEVLDE